METMQTMFIIHFVFYGTYSKLGGPNEPRDIDCLLANSILEMHIIDVFGTANML